MESLTDLKDIHKGERCFIIGTGPSLNKTNLSLLKDEICFGVGGLYRGYDKFNIKCQYYAVSDTVAWRHYGEDILNLLRDTVLFISSEIADDFGQPNRKKFFVINDIGSMWITNCFSKDIEIGAFNGDNIIIDICLQACFYMGFKEVYLVGCDCDYDGKHHFDEVKIATGSGPHGIWWKVFTSYEVCKRAYESDGREIINATVGGKLKIFKRKRLEDIIAEIGLGN